MNTVEDLKKYFNTQEIEHSDTLRVPLPPDLPKNKREFIELTFNSIERYRYIIKRDFSVMALYLTLP